MEQVSQGLKTNNSEQLESRSISEVKEDANNQHVHRKEEEEGRPKRQTEEKTSFQYLKEQQQPQQKSAPSPGQAAQATVNRSTTAIDIMA